MAKASSSHIFSRQGKLPRFIPIMLDFVGFMNDLERNRPVFHSEADFQHAFAWCIRGSIPDDGVRLEFKPFPDNRMYFDIWLPGIGMAVELKYRTRKLNLLCEGESFALRDQGAQDVARYDFLKDIQRLEMLQRLPKAQAGFAVLLTNDPTLWKHPSRPDTVDAAFRLHEGRTITGEMAWSERASAGTTKGRKDPIRLNASYDLHWRDYAEIGDGDYRRFRYLAVQVSF